MSALPTFLSLIALALCAQRTIYLIQHCFDRVPYLLEYGSMYSVRIRV